MKYHLTIKDNETGEILNDGDYCAIIGGVSTEKETTEVVLTDCEALPLIFCASSAQDAIDTALPEKMRLLLKLLGGKK